eukprot:Skav217831  [mRNA]  locus=scaffold889:518911:519603:+ [translate_table: standard]
MDALCGSRLAQASRLFLLEPPCLVFASMRLFCILVACLHVLSSAINETNKVGNETIQVRAPSCPNRYYINVNNKCHKTVRVGITYRQPDGASKTECWWTISPDVSTYLNLESGDRIVTENRIWAYYAEALDESIRWQGTNTIWQRFCPDKRVWMRNLDFVNSNGDLYVGLICSNGFVEVEGTDEVTGLSGPNISSTRPNISNISSEGVPKEQVEQSAPGVHSAPTPELLP